jgi:hypothetical protein
VLPPQVNMVEQSMRRRFNTAAATISDRHRCTTARCFLSSGVGSEGTAFCSSEQEGSSFARHFPSVNRFLSLRVGNGTIFCTQANVMAYLDGFSRVLIGLAPQQDSHPCWPSLAGRLSVWSYPDRKLHAEDTTLRRPDATLRNEMSYRRHFMSDKIGSAPDHNIPSRHQRI